jgi:ATP-dependent exoDNAse (exonuclease V) beta subunit
MVVEDMIIEEDMAKLEVDLDVLLVDEVQDCSNSDWELINLISEKYNK